MNECDRGAWACPARLREEIGAVRENTYTVEVIMYSYPVRFLISLGGIALAIAALTGFVFLGGWVAKLVRPGSDMAVVVGFVAGAIVFCAAYLAW